MPRLSDLLPGDLISDLDDDDHFMMWVGGHDGELVENVDAGPGSYAGVFRHSSRKLAERVMAAAPSSPPGRARSLSLSPKSSVKPTPLHVRPRRDSVADIAWHPSNASTASTASEVGSDSDSDSDSDSEDGEGFAVFRCSNRAFARQAAKFAVEWATSKSDDRFIKGKASGESFKLKVPFNQDRLTHDREQPAQLWNAASLFRALRVLARHDSGTPVSVKGWTCSSFATYCYQAAALHVLFKSGHLDEATLSLWGRQGSKKEMGIKNNVSLINMVLCDYGNVARLLPPGILVDGKAIDATTLREVLSEADSGFAKLGNITP